MRVEPRASEMLDRTLPAEPHPQSSKLAILGLKITSKGKESRKRCVPREGDLGHGLGIHTRGGGAGCRVAMETLLGARTGRPAVSLKGSSALQLEIHSSFAGTRWTHPWAAKLIYLTCDSGISVTLGWAHVWGRYHSHQWHLGRLLRHAGST